MPGTPDALIAQAAVYYRAGAFDAAAQCGLAIVAQAPEHFDALHLLGVLCLNRGQAADAVCYLTRAARLQPDHEQMNVNLGNAWSALKLFPRAEDASRQLVATHPHNLDAWNNLGFALGQQHRDEEAIAVLRTALAYKPDFAPASFNMGKSLTALGRLDEAVAAFRTALRFAPPDTSAERIGDIISELGRVLVELDRPEEALALLQGELARHPGLLDLVWNMSLLHLQLGDYTSGWRGYESRWQVKDHDKPRPDATIPDIAAIAGKRILVTGEQGRGDVIQFVRYAPLLAERGASVYLGVYDDLIPLLSGMPGVARVMGEDEQEPAYDIVTPLLSLPLAFGTKVETIPAGVPYLRADPDRVVKWKLRLGTERGPRVGLTWSSGNPGATRATRLEAMRPLLSCANVSFHALQKELNSTDLEFLRRGGRVQDHRAALTDYAETAALIEALDLVVTIDTGVAHLAGALGKPVWIMLPYVAEWRWLRHREDSPWYPTARLFRQAAPGDWDGLAARVAVALMERYSLAPIALEPSTRA